MIFAPTPPGCAGLDAHQLLGCRLIEIDGLVGDVRHLVLADGAGRHRLMLKSTGTDVALACLVVADTSLKTRLAAIAVFLPHSGDWRKRARVTALRPTPFQRHRLSILLRVADCLTNPGMSANSIRHIARLIYPRMSPMSAIEWKTSPERRQTQRLIQDTRTMLAGGYRILLRGRPD
jgi:hypothetical protein